MSELAILSTITIENASTILLVIISDFTSSLLTFFFLIMKNADRYNATELRRQVFEFIVKHFDAVSKVKCYIHHNIKSVDLLQLLCCFFVLLILSVHHLLRWDARTTI